MDRSSIIYKETHNIWWIFNCELIIDACGHKISRARDKNSAMPSNGTLPKDAQSHLKAEGCLESLVVHGYPPRNMANSCEKNPPWMQMFSWEPLVFHIHASSPWGNGVILFCIIVIHHGKYDWMQQWCIILKMNPSSNELQFSEI